MNSSVEINYHQSLVNLYYSRDLEMNLNNSQTILKALIKLKYYNIDIQSELNNFYLESLLDKIKNELKNNWNSSIKNKTLNELLTFDSSPELIRRIERSHILSEYLTKTDTFDFYNSLTLKELEYLGY